MEYSEKEALIKGLYNSMTGLPEEKLNDKDYYFDEATGTYYVLTGKRQMDKPSIESALKYFRSSIEQYSGSKNPGDYNKAVYCAIAVEAIAKMMGGDDKNTAGAQKNKKS